MFIFQQLTSLNHSRKNNFQAQNGITCLLAKLTAVMIVYAMIYITYQQIQLKDSASSVQQASIYEFFFTEKKSNKNNSDRPVNLRLTLTHNEYNSLRFCLYMHKLWILFVYKRIIPIILQKATNQIQALRKTAIFQISTNSPIWKRLASFQRQLLLQ